MIEKVRKSRIASLFMVLMLLASMSGAFTADSMAQSVAQKNFQAMQIAAQEDSAGQEVTDPVVTDPEETDPEETDPVETDPVETDPVVTDPVVTDPVETDPVVTDPVVTDPVGTDPEVTEPASDTENTDDATTEDVDEPVKEEAPNPDEVDTPENPVVPAQSRQMAPAQDVNYCDYTQKPRTTTWAEWFSEAPGPCLTVVNNQPEVCGVVDFSLQNDLVNFPSAVTHTLYWSEGPYAWNNRNLDFPHTFPEDYNGGTVDIYIAYVTNESDYINGMGVASHEIYQYYSAISGGKMITIDTDCLPNIPTPEENSNYYCETVPTVGGGVANWLRLAKEGGYNTDCLNVGAPVQECGTLVIPYENLTPYNSALYWNIGTEPDGNAGQALPITSGTFTEDQNGGEVVVTVWIGHPESDYYPYIGEADQAYTYAAGGVQFTIDTDCIDPIGDPGLPTPIEPAVCQMSFAGYTVMTSSGVTVREKIGGDEQGEVNADGWGGQVGADGWAGTMRLYGATRHDLTNVTMTWKVMGGGQFLGLDGTENTPGGGALQGNGYVNAVEGYTISWEGDTVTAHIEYMPANSSLSFNMKVAADEGQPKMYLHSWMIGTDPNCAPAVLELPEITPSVCSVDYEVVPPVVTAPADSESVTYGEVTLVEEDDAAAMSFMQVAATTATYTFTATANEGFTFEGVTMPEGWTYVSPTSATFSVTVDLAVCEIPVTPPVTPTVTPTETPTATPTETPTETPTATPTETAVPPTVAPTVAPTEAAKAPVTGLPSTGAGDESGNGVMWMTVAGVTMLAIVGLGIRRKQVN